MWEMQIKPRLGRVAHTDAWEIKSTLIRIILKLRTDARERENPSLRVSVFRE
jgi:hypothetical protein